MPTDCGVVKLPLIAPSHAHLAGAHRLPKLRTCHASRCSAPPQATPALLEAAVGYVDTPIVQFPGPGTDLKGRTQAFHSMP